MADAANPLRRRPVLAGDKPARETCHEDNPEHCRVGPEAFGNTAITGMLTFKDNKTGQTGTVTVNDPLE